MLVLQCIGDDRCYNVGVELSALLQCKNVGGELCYNVGSRIIINNNNLKDLGDLLHHSALKCSCLTFISGNLNFRIASQLSVM